MMFYGRRVPEGIMAQRVLNNLKETMYYEKENQMKENESSSVLFSADAFKEVLSGFERTMVSTCKQILESSAKVQREVMEASIETAVEKALPKAIEKFVEELYKKEHPPVHNRRIVCKSVAGK